ncbi:hypothetical protein D3C76_1839290 [compost metagenome]
MKPGGQRQRIGGNHPVLLEGVKQEQQERHQEQEHQERQDSQLERGADFFMGMHQASTSIFLLK